jgi:hypothetical protein
VASDGEQSDGDRMESKSRERMRSGKSRVGELSPCTHAQNKDGCPRRMAVIVHRRVTTRGVTRAGDRRKPFKLLQRLTSGPRFHFVFS